ncbi:MAG: CRISPR-associated helicase/endonuclease Cas3 [Planctomycetaceae bacterium]|nr:CRISPR-associated helicase/endonuclease Cas3 [Planctomycetaceae bacterium]
MNQYFAHSLPPPHPQTKWELLACHLREVAEHAKGFAGTLSTESAPLVQAAEAAGLLHDLGKYRAEFQQYIRGGLAKGNPLTHHKQAGAARAFLARHAPVAFAIAGHHGGIPDLNDLKQSVLGPSGKAVAEQVWDAAVADCPELAGVSLTPPAFDSKDNLGAELFTRLLFSCLVDADWTATGEFERRAHRRPDEPKTPELNPTVRLTHLLNFIDERAKQVGATNVAHIREQVLNACLAAAEKKPGVFTLTVPTGGGKTLSGMAFALKHAEKYGLRRVIYVAPYLSIIEQNADVIRKALGVNQDDPDVFEHHSLAEPTSDDTDEKAREAAARRAENWDAPLVVTTNVQFFESLFSNKPGRCRKLHNIAKSVILLDECQALPPGLVAPTCGMLKQVAEMMGSTIVLCTATQPAFDHATLKDDRLVTTEIIPSDLNLFKSLKRVELEWPDGNDIRWSWSEVADRMAKEQSSLCVVNTKKAASAVFDELKARGLNGVFHLSTAMCPTHRLEKLAEVRRRLKANKPTYLVSTQLIEAGVDISFPMVLRELGPLEGIIQAAGRCNREGELPNAGGRVIVFRSEEMKMPPGWYAAGWDKVEQALRLNQPPQIDVPGDIQEYYERLYNSGNLDEQDVIPKRRGFLFESAAKAYELIDDAGQPVVVTTWKEHEVEIRDLVDRVRDITKPRRAAFRALARFQVNVRHWEIEKLRAQGLICDLDPDLNLLGWFGEYSPHTGLITVASQDVLIG